MGKGLAIETPGGVGSVAAVEDWLLVAPSDRRRAMREAIGKAASTAPLGFKEPAGTRLRRSGIV
jgi:hypothetical protein